MIRRKAVTHETHLTGTSKYRLVRLSQYIGEIEVGTPFVTIRVMHKNKLPSKTSITKIDKQRLRQSIYKKHINNSR